MRSQSVKPSMLRLLRRLVDKSGRAAAVDPAEPKPIIDAAKKEGITIDAVLTTHKHW